MAIRPVFISDPRHKEYVKRIDVNFEWYPGFSVTQKQKSIKSLHNNVLKLNGLNKVLEVSSKSQIELGVALSAFNLMIETKNQKKFSVESAFQSSKVFERGGPFLDLLNSSSKKAKKDPRLKSHGRLIRFQYFKREWPLEPKTLFYDWLYINALSLNRDVSEKVLNYNAFTDIEFNPDKSINCQARSAALYVSLHRAGLLDYVLSSIQNYFEILGEDKDKSKKFEEKENFDQISFFDK